MEMWVSILVSISLMQSIQGSANQPFIQQVDGFCVLRDFNQQFDVGKRHGFRIWFGDLIRSNVVFFTVDPSSGDGSKTIAACEDFFLSEAGTKVYSELHVAFFDEQSNLIACGGDSDPLFAKPITENSSRNFLPMEIPVELHQKVRNYKCAYYESELPIGKSDARPDSYTPEWKSDGELRGTPFVIRPGSRLISAKDQTEWSAEMIEGKCSFKGLGDNDASVVDLFAGDKLKTKVKCHVSIDENHYLVAEVNYQNPTDRKKFGRFYISLFDEFGNLVSCLNYGFDVAPKSARPEIKIDGKIQPAGGFESSSGMSIPIGFKEKIAFYKITVYESNNPIGALQATNK